MPELPEVESVRLLLAPALVGARFEDVLVRRANLRIPFPAAFDAAVLAATARGRKTPLKALLLDQRVVAGLGNIYASEALWVARLSPARRASTIATPGGAPRPTAGRLAAAIVEVLKRAIGGVDRFRVYDREGQRCARRACGGRVRRIVQAGRSTFYCPVCQR